MLRRDFSKIGANTCQIQQKTLPPHIDILQLESVNSSKQILCLVKFVEILLTHQKIQTSYSLTMVMVNSLSELMMVAMMSLTLLLVRSRFSLSLYSETNMKNLQSQLETILQRNRYQMNLTFTMMMILFIKFPL